MVDAIISDAITKVIAELNNLKVRKENIISIFQNKEGMYIAIFYI